MNAILMYLLISAVIIPSFGFHVTRAPHRLTASNLLAIPRTNEDFMEFVKTDFNRSAVIDEIDFRLNSLDFSALCECLLTLKQEGRRDYRIRNIVSEALQALIRATPSASIQAGSTISISERSGIHPKAIVHLLISLVRFYSWPQLPEQARAALLLHLKTILHSADSALLDLYPDIVWSLGKLKATLPALHSRFYKLLESPALASSPGISKLLYGYALLDIKWKQLSSESKKNIIEVSWEQLDHMNEQGVDNFVYALAKMGTPWSALRESQQVQLFDNIVRIMPFRNDQGIAAFLWAVSKLGCRWKYTPLDVQEALFERAAELSPLSPLALSTILFSFAKMGTQRQDLPPSFLHTLQESLNIYTKASEQSVSNFIYGLGSVGFTWRDLSGTDRMRLKEAVDYALPSLSPQGLSNILWGLAKMGEVPREDSVSRELVSNLLDVSVVLLPRMESQGVSLSIWAMGHLFDARAFDSLPPVLVDSVYEAIQRCHGEFTEQGLANTLLGLAKLGSPWDSLPSALRARLLKQLLQVESSMTQQGVANSMWALSMMQMDLHTHPEGATMMQYFFRLLVRMGPELCMQSLATVLNAFTKFNYQYTEIDPQLTASFAKSFIVMSSKQSVKAHEVGVVVYCLAKLNMQLSTVPAEFRMALKKSIAKCCDRFTEQELGNVIWGLGQMGLNFNDMTSSFREILFKAVVRREADLRVQALVGILQGLEHGQMTWTQLHPSLRKSLLQAAMRLLLQHGKSSALSIILIYALGRLCTPWTMLPVPFTETLLSQVVPDTKASMLSMSKLSSLLNGLACMSMTYSVLEMDFKTALSDRLVRGMGELTGPEFSSTLWALARMGMTTGTAVNSQLFEVILAHLGTYLPTMAPGELAWSLWALGKLEIEFRDLPKDVQGAVIESTKKRMIDMSPREQGVSFWGMTRMAIPFNDLSGEDRYSIVLSMEELARQSLLKQQRVVSRQEDE